MPRIPIATEYRTGEGGDRFPKIKMQTKGERTRFTLFETYNGEVSVYSEYVHYLRAPKFKSDGTPAMVEKDSTRNPGEKYSDYDYEFIGAQICLGDIEIIKANGGLDVKNCPACEASLKSGGDVRPPEVRFAANVMVYAIRPSGDIMDPFSATIKIWNFTGRQFDEILGIQTEIGPLRDHDLVLECESPTYQKVKLSFRQTPGWRSAPQGYLATLVNTPGNKATDEQLRDSLGRDVPRTRMQEDANHCVRQWARLRNEGQATPYATNGQASLDGGLDALLAGEGGAAAATGAVTSAASQADPFADLAGTPQAGPAAVEQQRQASEETADPFAGLSEFAAASSAPAPAAPAPVPSRPRGDLNYDDLLAGL
jgi:hypothetical protein